MFVDRVFQDSLNSPEFCSVLPAYWAKSYEDMSYGWEVSWRQILKRSATYFKTFLCHG